MEKGNERFQKMTYVCMLRSYVSILEKSNTFQVFLEQKCWVLIGFKMLEILSLRKIDTLCRY